MKRGTLTQTEQRALEQLTQVFAAIPFNQFLGMTLVEITPESVCIQLTMKEVLVGNFLQGILHGGVISSVLDMAGGMVVMARAIHLHPSQSLEALSALLGKVGTVNLNINYLNPGRGLVFLAKAQLSKYGRKLAFAQMEFSNQEEQLIATASGTYLIN